MLFFVKLKISYYVLNKNREKKEACLDYDLARQDGRDAGLVMVSLRVYTCSGKYQTGVVS